MVLRNVFLASLLVAAIPLASSQASAQEANAPRASRKPALSVPGRVTVQPSNRVFATLSEALEFIRSRGVSADAWTVRLGKGVFRENQQIVVPDNVDIVGEGVDSTSLEISASGSQYVSGSLSFLDAKASVSGLRVNSYIKNSPALSGGVGRAVEIFGDSDVMLSNLVITSRAEGFQVVLGVSIASPVGGISSRARITGSTIEAFAVEGTGSSALALEVQNADVQIESSQLVAHTSAQCPQAPYCVAIALNVSAATVDVSESILKGDSSGLSATGAQILSDASVTISSSVVTGDYLSLSLIPSYGTAASTETLYVEDSELNGLAIRMVGYLETRIKAVFSDVVFQQNIESTSFPGNNFFFILHNSDLELRDSFLADSTASMFLDQEIGAIWGDYTISCSNTFLADGSDACDLLSQVPQYPE